MKMFHPAGWRRYSTRLLLEQTHLDKLYLQDKPGDSIIVQVEEPKDIIYSKHHRSKLSLLCLILLPGFFRLERHVTYLVVSVKGVWN